MSVFPSHFLFSVQETPIKSAQVRKVIHQSFRELHEAESISNGVDYDKDIFRKSWSAGQIVTCNAIATSSPATQIMDKFVSSPLTSNKYVPVYKYVQFCASSLFSACASTVHNQIKILYSCQWIA